MTTEETAAPSDVTCPSCRRTFSDVPRNEHGFALLDTVYQCGARAGVEMGCQMVYTTTGRTALCIVRRRDRVVARARGLSRESQC